MNPHGIAAEHNVKWMNEMNQRDLQSIVLRFNECINNRDAEGLANLMTEETEIIMGDVTDRRGKQAVKEAWIEFFNLFPDYKNHFKKLVTHGDRVHVIGFSTCSNRVLDGPALWTARVENGLIAEWRILEDNPENRKSLGL